MRKLNLWLGWLFLGAATVLAAGLEEDRDLLGRCAQRYAALRSYRCRVDSAFAYRMGAEQRQDRVTFRLRLCRPNRLAFVPEFPDKLPLTVCDGRSLWQTLPSRREYVEGPAPLRLEEVVLDVRDLGRSSPLLSGLCLRWFTEEGRTRLLKEADQVKFVGREEVQGSPCRRIRLVYSAKGVLLDVWIDEAGGLVRRMQLDSTASAALHYRQPLEETRVVLTEEYGDIAVDQEMPDDEFRFSAAGDWRRVEELNRGGEGERLGPEARALVGKPAPVMAVWNADGSVLSAPAGDGRPQILLFWREGEAGALALDTLDALCDEYSRRGVRFLAVAVGRSPGARDIEETVDRVAALARRRGYVTPIAFDRRGLGAAAYQIEILPMVAVVDRDGKLKNFYPASVIGLRRRLRSDLDAVAAR